MKQHNFLIVGGAGYIGSHTVKVLLEKEHRVVVLDNLSKGHRGAVAGCDFILGDLSDMSLLGNIFTTRKIDCVMHFAACNLVGESVEQPLSYYQNNTAGTTNLLMAMRDHGVAERQVQMFHGKCEGNLLSQFLYH